MPRKGKEGRSIVNDREVNRAFGGFQVQLDQVLTQPGNPIRTMIAATTNLIIHLVWASLRLATSFRMAFWSARRAFRVLSISVRMVFKVPSILAAISS